jgi:indolepyruvate ferredoxin oxidoreductase
VISATRIAEGLFGDSVAANTFLVGYAWQMGLLPVAAAAIFGAIEANGAAVELNKRAFSWGRMAAVDLASVERMAGMAEAPPPASPEAETLDALISRRADDLVAYQSPAYAARYRALVERARAAAAPLGVGGAAFARTVAVNAYRLMAYKDEYEVARLYADPEFRRALEAQFSGVGRLSVWLAPPILSRPDPATGRPAKRKFGPWIFSAFRVLAAMKALRGNWFDPFGHTEERRAERRLITEYFALVERLARRLDPRTLTIATDLATSPQAIRGFGPVKALTMDQVATQQAALLDRLQALDAPAAPALALTHASPRCLPAAQSTTTWAASSGWPSK